jgi:hypothetical protein
VTRTCNSSNTYKNLFPDPFLPNDGEFHSSFRIDKHKENEGHNNIVNNPRMKSCLSFILLYIHYSCKKPFIIYETSLRPQNLTD